MEGIHHANLSGPIKQVLLDLPDSSSLYIRLHHNTLEIAGITVDGTPLRVNMAGIIRTRPLGKVKAGVEAKAVQVEEVEAEGSFSGTIVKADTPEEMNWSSAAPDTSL